MDIVGRLKFFMESQRIANSQFADTCRIPRPTLSQLLNGRNKKISDELISKIHQAYPSLSVLWLMFGEGDMLTQANNEFSEPQNDLFAASISDSHVGSQTINFIDVDEKDESDRSADNPIGANRPGAEHKSVLNPGAVSQTDPHDSATISADNGNISFIPNSNKTITRILVFYSDNSFQEFTRDRG